MRSLSRLDAFRNVKAHLENLDGMLAADSRNPKTSGQVAKTLPLNFRVLNPALLVVILRSEAMKDLLLLSFPAVGRGYRCLCAAGKGFDLEFPGAQCFTLGLPVNTRPTSRQAQKITPRKGFKKSARLLSR
jgi:hypothetical protein